MCFASLEPCQLVQSVQQAVQEACWPTIRGVSLEDDLANSKHAAFQFSPSWANSIQPFFIWWWGIVSHLMHSQAAGFWVCRHISAGTSRSTFPLKISDSFRYISGTFSRRQGSHLCETCDGFHKTCTLWPPVVQFPGVGLLCAQRWGELVCFDMWHFQQLDKCPHFSTLRSLTFNSSVQLTVCLYLWYPKRFDLESSNPYILRSKSMTYSAL